MTKLRVSLAVASVIFSVISAANSALATQTILRGPGSGYSDAPSEESSPFESVINAQEQSPASKLYFGPNFPLPASLAPNVEFWIGIYSRYSTNQWVIHDRDNLSIIYDVVSAADLFPGSNPNSRRVEDYVSKRRKEIAAILRNLHKNRGAASNPEEARIANALPFRPAGSSYYLDLANGLRSQRGQADRFLEGLRRSGMHINHMRSVFRQYGLPIELTALPHVESSFNYAAYSKVGAAGIWQFTRGTGKKFMKIDYLADERRDPIISTHAAARLLKINFETLGSWPLAVIAYNHGLNGMSKAVTRHGADLVEIIDSYQSRAFGFASKNFYSEFLAALEVSRNHEKYFGSVSFMPETKFDEITASKSISAMELARASGVDIDTLKQHNRALTDAVWRGRCDVPVGYRIRIPEGKGGLAALAMENLPASRAVRPSAATEIVHVVKRGETPGGIAMAYGVPARTLLDANGIEPRGLIAGKKIIIPSPARISPRYAQAIANNESSYYFVKEGDSISSIASERGISQETLALINGLSDDASLFPGQKLLVKKEMSIFPSAYEKDIAAAPSAENEKPMLVSAILPETGSDGPDFLVNSDQQDGAVSDPAGETADASPESASPAVDESSIVVNGDPSIDPKVYSFKSVKGGVGILAVGPEETISLYSRWAGVSASAIRRMNDGRKNPGVGSQLKIPLQRISPQQFEKKRMEFHSAMLAKFMETYEFKNEKKVVVTPGKSVWRLCVLENKTPLWLVHIFNPDKEIRKLLPGDVITLPTFIRK